MDEGWTHALAAAGGGSVCVAVVYGACKLFPAVGEFIASNRKSRREDANAQAESDRVGMRWVGDMLGQNADLLAKEKVEWRKEKSEWEAKFSANLRESSMIEIENIRLQTEIRHLKEELEKTRGTK